MITRCLAPFAFEIASKPIGQWADVWRNLPRDCPHADCSGGAKCREVCGAYAKVQKAVVLSRGLEKAA